MKVLVELVLEVHDRVGNILLLSIDIYIYTLSISRTHPNQYSVPFALLPIAYKNNKCGIGFVGRRIQFE